MGLSSSGKSRILVDTASIASGDSIASYLVDSAGALLTSTLIGADQALDVNVVSGTYAEDSAHASGDRGFAVWAVRNDAGTALAGTDGDYIPFSTNATGALRVAGTFTSNAEKAEDAAHSSGDTGNYVLSVRKDAAGSGVSADGDYASFQQTKDGYLRTASLLEQSVLQQIVSVTTTAAAVPATALTNRKHILIQNLGAGLVYLGSATVTADETATGGIVLAKGGTYEADLSDAVSIYAITTGAAKNVAVLESA